MADPAPFDESLMPAEEPAALAEIVLDERHLAYARKRWPDASERMQHYRVRQAIWIRFQTAKPHPDDPTRRKVGGVQPGGGRRVTKQVGAALVEAAQARQKEVIDAAFAPLSNGNDPMDRHKAAMNIAKLEREERAMEIVEDEYARKTNEDVLKEAAAIFVEMVRNGELSLDDIADADVVDDDQRQIAS